MSNFSKDIALTSFSGYMAFSGAVAENAKLILNTRKAMPIFGLVLLRLNGGGVRGRTAVQKSLKKAFYMFSKSENFALVGSLSKTTYKS